MTTRDALTSLPAKEYFESKLAITLLDQHALFPSVKKISKFIIEFIKNHKDGVLGRIETEHKITEELYDKIYFGRLHEKDKTAHDKLERIISILSDDNSKLKQVMQIHCVFIHRIYKHLIEHTVRKQIENLEKQFSCLALFPDKHRGRQEITISPQSTRQLGIMRDSVCYYLYDSLFLKPERKYHASEKHIRGLDRFSPAMHSDYYKDIERKEIPFVAGPSSHTASLMTGMLLYDVLSMPEKQEYALACFAFLAAAGNHSFHEVMVVAKKAGIIYEENNYLASIPSSIQSTDVFAQLKEIFPEFLTGNIFEKKDQKIVSRMSFINSLKNLLLNNHDADDARSKVTEEDKIARLVFQFI